MMDYRMKIRSKGFSLIELMVAISISAILVGLAVPEFNRLIRRNSVEASTNLLQSSFAFARSEAIKRATNVSVVPNVANGSNWPAGWQVILDNGTLEPDCTVTEAQGERTLRQVDAQRGGTLIFENNAAGSCVAAAAARGCFTFDREGNSMLPNGNRIRRGFCVQDSNNTEVQRVIGFPTIGHGLLEKSRL
jgi:prepilin-type N-terminal cleavage/methylation domain-containing protein